MKTKLKSSDFLRLRPEWLIITFFFFFVKPLYGLEYSRKPQNYFIVNPKKGSQIICGEILDE